MKKLLSILTLCMGLCCVSCYDDSALIERIDALEKNAIASINEQISAIKASITSLEAVDVELKSTIKALEAKDATLQGDIDELKEADASLETKIGELKTYVDDEISNTEDWATATFATLEQYDSLCIVLTGIETSISELKEEFTKNLSDAISNSEESMKGWVNEQLTGYWTIAETQARLDTLKQTHNEEVENLSTDLADAKEELTEAYTTAISTAIEELDGKLSDEITKINDELTQRMDDIEDRLSAIEETLKNLTRDFSIAFDDYDIGILAGGTTSVGYIITGATEKTTVKALGQNGWSAKVTPDGTDKGTITVTAPNPLTEDEIIVLVYDGEFRTIMSSINFVTGIVTPSQTAVELDAEAGTVDITVTSNLNYKVSIPEEAKDWLSVVETKATKTDTITFAFTECVGGIRKTIVSFIDEVNNTISNTTFVQQGSAVEVTLIEAGTLLSKIGEDVYKSIKGLTINGPINGTDVLTIRRMESLMYLNMANSQIVAGGAAYNSTYTTKDNEFGDGMLIGAQCYNLKEIIFPNTITIIGNDACKGLELEKITIPDCVTKIGSYAFWPSPLSEISHLILPKEVTFIGTEAFCEARCKEVTIPSKVRSIGFYSFSGAIKTLHLKPLPTTLTDMGLYALGANYNGTTIYVPQGTKEAYLLTDIGNYKNLYEE